MKRLKIVPTFNQVTLNDMIKVSEFEKNFSKFVHSLSEVYPLMSRLRIEYDDIVIDFHHEN